MKNKLTALFLVFILIACTGLKKTTKSDIKSDVKTATEVSKSTEANKSEKITDKSEKLTDKTLEQIEKETNELETRILLYDTDKPIVPGTNKPPVKEERIITSRKAANKTSTSTTKDLTKTDLTNNVNTSLISEMDSLLKRNAKLISETDSTEKETNTSWWKWLLGGVGVCVVGCGVWKLVL